MRAKEIIIKRADSSVIDYITPAATTPRINCIEFYILHPHSSLKESSKIVFTILQ